MLGKISVIILTKNSARHLRSVLDALVRFGEVVIVDNGSTDNTLQIAQSFDNVKIFEHDFIGFGPLKRYATSLTSNEWVLSIDSDEIVTDALVDEIERVQYDDRVVYAIKRDNYYKKRLIKCCGWDNDYVLRLFNKNSVSFNEKKVHESLALEGVSIVKLKHTMHHYSSQSIEELMSKMQHYSTLFAQEHRGIRRSSSLKAVARALFAFVKSYLFKRGFLYGYEGLVISVSNANGVFYKYMKLLESNQSVTVALIITTYNWTEALEAVLQSAFSQTVLPTEIIIADDGSSEETKELIGKMRKLTQIPIVHFWQEDRGFRAASARNGAIRESNSEYIVMIDGDMILEPHFIEDHLSAARKNTFIQGRRALLTKETTQRVLSSGKYTFSCYDKGIKNRKNMIRSEILSKIFSVYNNTIAGIRTCSFALYREDAYLVNGFNEAFTGWGREDSEFVVRLMNAGVKRKDMRFKAIAYHLYHPVNVRKSLPQNDTLLSSAIEEHAVWCEKGLI